MSADWVSDIANMHDHYGHTPVFHTLNPDKLKALLQFRVDFLDEELTEIKEAQSAEDVVDGLIDLCVVAIGTLHAFGVDSYRAWEVVNTANMAKETGIKETRPNPLGLPDLIKPEGWVAPSHEGNHGRLSEISYDVSGS